MDSIISSLLKSFNSAPLDDKVCLIEGIVEKFSPDAVSLYEEIKDFLTELIPRLLDLDKSDTPAEQILQKLVSFDFANIAGIINSMSIDADTKIKMIKMLLKVINDIDVKTKASLVLPMLGCKNTLFSTAKLFAEEM